MGDFGKQCGKCGSKKIRVYKGGASHAPPIVSGSVVRTGEVDRSAAVAQQSRRGDRMGDVRPQDHPLTTASPASDSAARVGAQDGAVHVQAGGGWER